MRLHEVWTRLSACGKFTLHQFRQCCGIAAIAAIIVTTCAGCGGSGGNSSTGSTVGQPASTELKIMPLGDSITEGWSANDGGYRHSFTTL